MIKIDKSVFKGYLQDNLNRVGAHYKILPDKKLNLDILSYIEDAFYEKKYVNTNFVLFIEFDKFRQTQFVNNEIRYFEKLIDVGKEDFLL